MRNNNENDRYRKLTTVYEICMLNLCKQSQRTLIQEANEFRRPMCKHRQQILDKSCKIERQIRRILKGKQMK